MKILDMFVCVKEEDLNILRTHLTMQEIKAVLQDVIDIEAQKKISELVTSHNENKKEAQ